MSVKLAEHFQKEREKKLLTNTKELGYTAELHAGTETVLQEKYTQTHEHLLIVCYSTIKHFTSAHFPNTPSQ